MKLSPYASKKSSFWDNLTLVVLLVVVWGLFAPSCRCEETAVLDAGTRGVVTTAQEDTTSSTSVFTTTILDDDEKDWAVVVDLNTVKGFWGGGEGEESDEGPWVELESREGNEKWDIPYPWRLRLGGAPGKKPWDCGLFERLQDDWRVGYCFGGDIEGGRSAHRVVISYKRAMADLPPQLRVNIGNKVVVTLDRE